MEPADGMAYIGHDFLDAPNIYYATGDSRHGMTHGTIYAGMLISDQILGYQNRWSHTYNPARLPITSQDFLQENVDTGWHYLEWFTSGDVGAEDAIDPGEGGIIQCGLAKRAVYRDENGFVHSRSAFCSHLGCVVAWNSTEKTWNCPCHGSQYDRYGRVIGGPSRSNLDD